MTTVGNERDLARAQERTGERIEAVCMASPGGSFGERFLTTAVSGRATSLSVLVLTTSKLYLFEPGLRGFGAELLCVPYSDIVHVEHRPKLLAVAFRLTLADGSHLALRALRGQRRGRDTVDRLTRLIAAGPSPDAGAP